MARRCFSWFRRIPRTRKRRPRPNVRAFRAVSTSFRRLPSATSAERVNLAAGGLFQLDVGLGESIFSVGGEVGYMGYGHVNREVDVSSLIPEIPNATLSVTTTNYMIPIARLRAQRKSGRWRPYVDALFGGNLISTDTSIDCSAGRQRRDLQW